MQYPKQLVTTPLRINTNYTKYLFQALFLFHGEALTSIDTVQSDVTQQLD